MDVDIITLLLLALVGLVAGFIDSIAGGGGMLALPSLLLAGLDPLSALATNKLQGTFGTASATYAFWKKGLIDPRQHWRTVALVFAGAAVGVLMVSAAPRALLSIIMPILLLAVALYFALSPRLTDEASEPVFPMAAFSFGLAPAIGFYDGFFGPGTGSFFMLALVSVFGLGLIEATARTKLLNFTSNVAALAVFAFTAKIVLIAGLVMGVAQVIGAYIGAHVAIRNGAKVIRPLLVTVCIAMAVKLLLDPSNPLRAYF
jgi:uncharacterized membrane protein YfcA